MTLEEVGLLVTATGVYYNEETHRFEAWACSPTTGNKLLVGTWDAGVPKDIRKQLEREIWKLFISVSVDKWLEGVGNHGMDRD